ncbi:MAG: hypothetical protein HFH74_07220 [Lachnospiraceae bacterium]|nr:hypothetical protein [Lachnospiraceae bacterium]
MKLDRARRIFEGENYICFTSDLDWAPDTAIEDTLKLFLENDITPTVFVTHLSRIINKYREKVDLGIHPNFIQPSSQGKNQEEIIEYCSMLVENTQVFRCHRWYSSNDIYDVLWEKGFRYESNLCTNMDLLSPFLHRSGMVCFPVFFEDGAYIYHGYEMNFKTIKDKFTKAGLKVVNMHPMHYALNTPYFKYTREIKDSLSREEWNGMTSEKLSELAYKGIGIREFMNELVSWVKESGIKVITLKQAYNMCITGEQL